MSLLDEATEEFIFMNKTKVQSAYSGTKNEYSEGISIFGAMMLVSNTQTKIAEANGTKAIYDFSVDKSVFLDFHDVLKRKSDGVYFRITNNADSYQTPESASLNMRQYTAEEFTLPT